MFVVLFVIIIFAQYQTKMLQISRFTIKLKKKICTWDYKLHISLRSKLVARHIQMPKNFVGL